MLNKSSPRDICNNRVFRVIHQIFRIMVNGPVINAIANLLGCAPYQLQRRNVTTPKNMNRIHDFLKTKTIRTTHLGEKNREVRFHHLTMSPASVVPAYNGFLGVNVQQHYYARHNIYLKYHWLPCIAEECGKNRYNYWPIEIVSLEDDSVIFW